MSSTARPGGTAFRLIVTGGTTLAGLVFILFLNFIFRGEEESVAAQLLVDFKIFLWPFSIQNIMWAVFFFALGDLSVRLIEGTAELRQLHRHLLPEDERTILRADDLGQIYSAIKSESSENRRFLPRLVKRVILQFQSNRSVDQASTLLNSSLELYLHEVDLKYNMARYIMWLIPSLGFIGTVIGIALALNYAGAANYQDPTLLAELTARLGTAFYTTLMALLLSAVLVFLIHLAQGREERALNDAGQYCLDNLINRLYAR